MAIRRRAPQGGNTDEPYPQSHSSYTPNSQDFGSGATTGNVGTAIAAATGSPTPSTTSSSSSSSLTPTPSPTSSPSATSTPVSGHRSPPAKTIVAIVVPVAVVLLIPLLYLLYRSHRMKKNAQKRSSSQRNSRETMLAKEMMETKNNHGPPPPRPRRSLLENKELPQIRPTNSLGLFNFDFSQPTSPAEDGQRTPPRLSIARSLQLRRSEVLGSKSGRKPQPSAGIPRDPLRNNPATGDRDSSTIVFGEPPPAYGSPGTGAGAGAASSESHFAPLNSIGTAVSHPPRPRPTRSPSSSNSVHRNPQSAPTPRTHPDASSAPAPSNSAFVHQSNRNIQPPTSTYSNTSTQHSSSLLPPLPTTFADRPPTPPPQESRPVSPLNSNSTRSTNTATTHPNYHIPDFGLGMGGGTAAHFSMSEYSDGPEPVPDHDSSSTPRPPTLQTFAHHPSGAYQPTDRISDVSGLSVDPAWLSQDERDRRYGPDDGGPPRISRTSSDHVVSPVDSHDGFRGRDRL